MHAGRLDAKPRVGVRVYLRTVENLLFVKVKVKGKIRPRICHKGPEGE